MAVDSNNIVFEAETIRDFSEVMRIAEKYGRAIIFKDACPKYMLVDLDNSPLIDMTDDEKIDFVAARVLKKYRTAFEELAK